MKTKVLYKDSKFWIDGLEIINIQLIDYEIIHHRKTKEIFGIRIGDDKVIVEGDTFDLPEGLSYERNKNIKGQRPTIRLIPSLNNEEQVLSKMDKYFDNTPKSVISDDLSFVNRLVDNEAKCSTCSKSKDNNPFCSNSFHLNNEDTYSKETQEVGIEERIQVHGTEEGKLYIKASDLFALKRVQDLIMKVSKLDI